MNLLVSLGVSLLALTSGAARVQHDVVYSQGPRGRLDVYTPRRLPPHAAVAVFIYGGSWQSGSKSLYRFVGLALASRGIITVIPDYRIYPDVRYPDFLLDNAKAVAFTRRHAADWGGDPKRLYLIGHSAGAYNAAMLSLDSRWLATVGMNSTRDVAGMIGLAGPYDFLPLRDPKLESIFGPEEHRRDTQPINHVDGSAAPIALFAGAQDSVVDPGNSLRLAGEIRNRGGRVWARIYPSLGHVGILTSLSGLFRRRASVLDDVMAFIDRDSSAMTDPSRSAAISPQPVGAKP